LLQPNASARHKISEHGYEKTHCDSFHSADEVAAFAGCNRRARKKHNVELKRARLLQFEKNVLIKFFTAGT
jgi:hypothetical protein